MSKQLSITQALPLLKYSRLSAYRHIKSGEIKATKSFLDGRAAWLINCDDLMFFIAKREEKNSKRLRVKNQRA